MLCVTRRCKYLCEVVSFKAPQASILSPYPKVGLSRDHANVDQAETNAAVLRLVSSK